jgi:hypothetical protein
MYGLSSSFVSLTTGWSIDLNGLEKTSEGGVTWRQTSAKQTLSAVDQESHWSICRTTA